MIYEHSLIPVWANVADESEDYLFLDIHRGFVDIQDVQHLREIGLRPLGATANHDLGLRLLCEKAKK